MKKLLFIALLCLIVFSCESNPAPKPKKLLTESQMANIMYDISLLQSIKSFNTVALDTNKVNASKYIFQKYKIDSLTFAQNHMWYASDLEKYEKIEKRVSDRLKSDKEKLQPKKDTVNKKNKPRRDLKLKKGLQTPATATLPK